MDSAQMGIFALGSSSHCYLEFRLLPGSSGLDLLGTVAGLELPQETVSGLNTVIGVRPSLWKEADPTDAPSVFEFSEPIVGPDGFTMPATQRDLFVWIAASSVSQAFDASKSVVEALGAYAQAVEELTGWSYRQNRDLIGFIDGLANPSLLEAPEVALIPEGLPGAYGSILLFQKWRHDLPSFERLSVDAQEKTVGRTKEFGEEFDENLLPIDSHVARTTLTEGDDELPIFRRNTAYGVPTENGTVFVGFSKDQRRLHTMLERMAGIPDGTRDSLTRYTTPLSGSYYFIPSVDALRRTAK